MDTRTPSDCLNCGAALTGPYCSQCGQHARHSARSLSMLMEDAWHLLTHVDGKLWGTVRALLLRPGFLTREYFAERRARYAPPFRLYLVVSLVYFALGALTQDTVDVIRIDSSTSPQERADPSLKERTRVHFSLRQPQPAGAGAAGNAGAGADTRTLQAECNGIDTGHPRLDTRLRTVCSRQTADHGRSLVREFSALAPKMMFVFLPLMAAVMIPFYLAQGRFYVEHLVFLLHLQSTVFLGRTLDRLVEWIGKLLPEPARPSLTVAAGLALTGYLAWYVYAALRCYYGERRGRTVLKGILLAVAYLALDVLATTVTLLASALVT